MLHISNSFKHIILVAVSRNILRSVRVIGVEDASKLFLKFLFAHRELPGRFQERFWLQDTRLDSIRLDKMPFVPVASRRLTVEVRHRPLARTRSQSLHLSEESYLEQPRKEKFNLGNKLNLTHEMFQDFYFGFSRWFHLSVFIMRKTVTSVSEVAASICIYSFGSTMIGLLDVEFSSHFPSHS